MPLALVRNTIPRKQQFAPRVERTEPAAPAINWLQPPLKGVALSLAAQTCTHCFGSGLNLTAYPRAQACECVLRRIYQAVLARRMSGYGRDGAFPTCRLSAVPRLSKRRSANWGFKHEEFRADVDLTIRRTLSPRDYQIFRLRSRGSDAAAIASATGESRGAVYHRIYAIEKALGTMFVSLQPYALFPIADYFSGSARMRRRGYYETRMKEAA